ncbi:MAG: hypothetical protein Q9179_004754 [Wetmoreana sp. 5 TL-2023]
MKVNGGVIKLRIAGEFIRPYLSGQTAAFFTRYPSQKAFPTPSVPPADPSETEDCLFLDVKTPANAVRGKGFANKKAPVLVWIHGGGYTSGYKTQFQAEALLARSSSSKSTGVVFVQLNYRLGAFGFLSGQGIQSNAGLLDQRLALEWVQAHIERFGGDPKQVTVMGESAGAGSIEYHVTSQDTALSRHSLFQRAVMQSPFFFPDPGHTQNQMVYQKFLGAVGTSSVKGAKAASAESLRVANYRFVLDASYGQFGFGPTVDKSFISASPANELLNGQFQKPLQQLLSHNSAEGIGFTYPWIFDNQDFNAYVKTLFPAGSAATISYITDTIYPPPSDAAAPYRNNLDRAALITGDVVITCNTYLVALAYENKTYNHLFDVSPGLHGDDLHYTFGPDQSTKSDQIRVAIQDYVTSFAATGNPNSVKQPIFQMYGRTNQVLALAPGSMAGKPDPAASNRCLLLQKHFFARRLESAAPKMRNFHFGGGNVGAGTFSTPETTSALLGFQLANNIRCIDTVSVYPATAPGASEHLITAANAAGKGFTIDTKIKVMGKGPSQGSLRREAIEQSLASSLHELAVAKVRNRA